MADLDLALSKRLAQAPSGRERLFATVDLANLHQHAEPALLRLQRANGICILGKVRRQAQLASPWLLEVPVDAASPLLSWSVSVARRHSAVTWLCSNRSLTELAMELQRRTEAQLPDQDPVLLRYFDPRVLLVLDDVLDDEQHGEFFELVSSWWLINRQQKLISLALRPAGMPSRFKQPLKISDMQFARMLRAAELDSVMPELVRQVPEEFLAMAPVDRIAFTQHWLERADSLKVEHYPDRVALCILAARLGQDFDKADPWSTLFARVASGSLTLTGALERAMEEGQ